MNYKLLWVLVVFLLFSVIVSASDTPPPIPTEYWGRLMIDGEPAPDGTPVSYFNGEEWINTTTISGWYNLILTGGDSPLTDPNDSDCSLHNANGTACITCDDNDGDPDNDCVEGPKEGDTVNITVNNTPVSVQWGDDASGDENIITSIYLYSGWNMISLPGLMANPTPSSLVSTLTGSKIIYYYNSTDNGDPWKAYNSDTPEFTWDLKSISPNKAYWVKVDSPQTLSVVSTKLSSNSFPLYIGWNMISFQLFNDTIQNTMSRLVGERIAYYYDSSDNGDPWKAYNSNTPEFTWDLTEISVGKGYWVKVDSNQNWVE